MNNNIIIPKKDEIYKIDNGNLCLNSIKIISVNESIITVEFLEESIDKKNIQKYSLNEFNFLLKK